MENTEKWVNLGDVHFYAWGGCLVRHSLSEEERKEYPSLNNLFDVITLYPDCDDEEQLAICLQRVDVDDIDFALKRDLLYAIGEESRKDEPMEKIMSPEMWAKELAEYNGFNGEAPGNPYPSREDFFVPKAVAVRFMRDHGVDAEVSGFYERIMEEYDDCSEDCSLADFLRMKLSEAADNCSQDVLDISDITDDEIRYLLSEAREEDDVLRVRE